MRRPGRPPAPVARASALVLLALLLSTPSAAVASPDAPDVIDYVVRHGDRVFGEVRSTREETPARLELLSNQRVRLSLLGVDQEVRETVRFAMDRASGTIEVGIATRSFFKSRSLEISIAGTRAVLLDRLTGDRKEFAAGEPIRFCMDFFLDRDLAALAPGDHFAYPVVDPDTMNLETQEVTVAAVADGSATFRIRRALYSSVETYDMNLDLVRAEVESLGLSIERVVAGAPASPVESYNIEGGDLLEFPSDIPVRAMRGARRLTATLAWRDLPAGELSLADARQSVRIVASRDGWTTAEVTVTRRNLAREMRRRIDRMDVSRVGEFLKPTALIRSESSRIRQVRDRAIGRERRLDRVAARACAFVQENIRSEVLPDLLSSDEVLEAGRGMCMQYGILLAALLRAAGVPTRCVMSLKWSDGRFLPHLSNEVWNGEAWLPVDATDPAAAQTELPPDAIRLACGNDLTDLSRLKARLLNNLTLAGGRVE